MESLVPNLFVQDINQTVKFYQGLGFELTMTNPPEGEFIWAMMTYGNVFLMFQTFDSLAAEIPEISRQSGGALLFYIKLKNIAEFHHRIKEKAKVIKGLEKTFYGAMEFSIVDNNGFVLTFAEFEE